jgi:hypothetical protein
MSRSIISGQKARPSLATAAFPSWLVWLGVIPLFSGIGAVLGNMLDVAAVAVPAGFGSDWTKLLGALFGACGVGLFVAVLVFS